MFIRLRQKTRAYPGMNAKVAKILASADVRLFLEKADRYSAKLPNANFGAKQNHLDGTTALAVGLHLNILCSCIFIFLFFVFDNILTHAS